MVSSCTREQHSGEWVHWVDPIKPPRSYLLIFLLCWLVMYYTTLWSFGVQHELGDTVPWLSLVFRRSRRCTGGAAKAELNPTSQTELDHFLYGSGRFHLYGRGATWFFLAVVSAIFYQMGERVSMYDSANSVFLRFLVGPKFSIDEGWLITKLRVFLSISAEAACWMMQTVFCWFCCREGNPFEQKKGCFIRLRCWFVSPPQEYWL